MMKHILTMAVIFFLISNPAFSQNAEEIVLKNVEARGGFYKIRAINSLYLKINISTVNLDYSVELFKKADKIRQVVHFPKRDIINIYKDNKLWIIKDDEIDKMPDEAINEFKDQIYVYLSFVFPELFLLDDNHVSAEFLNEENAEGKPAFKLALKQEDGTEKYIFVSKDNYLDLQIITKQLIKGREIDLFTVFLDYQKYQDFQIPFNILLRTSNEVITDLILDKIEINNGISDDLFKTE